MARTDYIDDPNAPKANSVVPSVVAIVTDEQGRVLLIHKTDNDLWGRYLVEVTRSESSSPIRWVREVKEETGYDVAVERVTGLYTNPGHVMAYDDGEVRQQFSIRTVLGLGGEARTSSESRAVEGLNRQPQDLDLHLSMRLRVQHALEHRDTPYIG